MSSKLKNNKTINLYENSFLEALTRCPFWVPPIIFLPAIFYFIYIGFTDLESINILIITLLGIGGVTFWTFIEYIIHRFIFHYRPTSKGGKRLIFMLHGVHHANPSDLSRLVFPLIASVPLAIGFFFLFKIIPWTNEGYGSIFYAFFLLGYLTYDMIHYASHAVSDSNRFFSRIKKHHLNHHFSESDSRYGVSSGIWDFVFKSLGQKRQTQ